MCYSSGWLTGEDDANTSSQLSWGCGRDYNEHNSIPPVCVCRQSIFAHLFVTFTHWAVPLYLVELSPPQYRGTVAGLYNTLYYVVSKNSYMCKSWKLMYIRVCSCDVGRVWSTSTPVSSRPTRLALVVVVADVLPRTCMHRHMVLSGISTLVSI